MLLPKIYVEIVWWCENIVYVLYIFEICDRHYLIISVDESTPIYLWLLPFSHINDLFFLSYASNYLKPQRKN